jgi:hypothetical protein
MSIGVQAFAAPNLTTLTAVTIYSNHIMSTSRDLNDSLLHIFGLNVSISRNVSLTIGGSVTTIGSNAFGSSLGMRGFSSVVIGNSVTTIGDQAFRGNRLTSIVIPSSVTNIGNDVFFNNPSLASITINSDHIMSVNRTSDSNLSHIFGVRYMTHNVELIVGNGVINIGEMAFAGHGLVSVIIGDSVLSIGNSAFNGRTAPGTLHSRLTNVVIGNSVTTIGTQAFIHANITSITLPSSLTSIGIHAFNNSALTVVNFVGTETAWNTMIAGNFAVTFNARPGLPTVVFNYTP